MNVFLEDRVGTMRYTLSLRKFLNKSINVTNAWVEYKLCVKYLVGKLLQSFFLSTRAVEVCQVETDREVN